MIPGDQKNSPIERYSRRSVPNPHPESGLVLLILFFAAANLIVPSLTWNVYSGHLQLLLIGGLMSEVVLLAIWTAFGTDESRRKLAWVSFLFAAAWFTWMIGIRLPARRPIPIPAGVIFAVGAILFMALATGAGLLYRSRTGRILCHHDRLYFHPRRIVQFSIKQILGWMTGVAVALVISQLLFDPKKFSMGNIRNELPILVGLALSYCALILIVSGACLELTLGSGSRIRSFCRLVVTVLAVSILATMVISAFLPGFPNRVTKLFGDTLAFFVGLSTTITLALTWIRWIGFRLVKVHERST